MENLNEKNSKKPLKVKNVVVSESKAGDPTRWTLKRWREKIEEQVPWVDIKPYSHNIIGISLGAIDKNYGRTEANKAIEDFGLEVLGWSKIK